MRVEKWVLVGKTEVEFETKTEVICLCKNISDNSELMR